jgi:hypothetical protein
MSHQVPIPEFEKRPVSNNIPNPRLIQGPLKFSTLGRNDIPTTQDKRDLYT